jgi:energy-converting hydrogenase A subunit M
MSEDIKNGNIFLVSGDFSKPPKIYSSFQRAEEVVLAQIRALDTNVCAFSDIITCIQIDTNAIRKTEYWGNIKIKDGFKYITIKRDEHNANGCKKIHREKIRISLDY